MYCRPNPAHTRENHSHPFRERAAHPQLGNGAAAAAASPTATPAMPPPPSSAQQQAAAAAPTSHHVCVRRPAVPGTAWAIVSASAVSAAGHALHMLQDTGARCSDHGCEVHSTYERTRALRSSPRAADCPVPTRAAWQRIPARGTCRRTSVLQFAMPRPVFGTACAGCVRSVAVLLGMWLQIW